MRNTDDDDDATTVIGDWSDWSDIDEDEFYDYDHLNVVIDDVTGQCLKMDVQPQSDIKEPTKYEHAIVGPLGPRWIGSMREEWEALLSNGTFYPAISRFDPKLRGRNITKSRWVYKIKLNRDGTIERYKSRFVVCGYSQRAGLDYDRTFSATLRASSFRVLLSLAAGKKMQLRQFDVSNAFTQAFMDDTVLYIEPPKGFEEWEIINGKKYAKVLQLRKALYGTKQASRLWHNTLRDWLTSPEIGFVQCKSDPCLFRKVDGDQEIIVGVYVDDIISAHHGDEMFKVFSEKFKKRFSSKDSKILNWFLGMAIDQHDDFSVDVCHSLSIEKLVEKYLPGNTTTREYPSNEIFNKLDRAQSDTERAKMESLPYASLVGALLYIAVMSRPDVAFHTSILAKFLSDPSPDGWKAAIILLQYLDSTKARKMHFSGKVEVPPKLSKNAKDITDNHGFVAYSDSSWGNRYPYPMFGYGIYLFGGLVSYASKQLKTVAFSSCEAEYAAGSFCCKEIEFVRSICDDLGLTLSGRLVLALDNTACIDIAFDVGVSGRTKHFDRAIHYLRDLTQLRRVLPTFVSTDNQRADGYTKALDKSTFLSWVPCVISR